VTPPDDEWSDHGPAGRPSIVMLPLELLTRAAPSTPASVMPPDAAETVTSPLPA